MDLLIPFPVILARAGFEDYNYDSKVYCPFHENYDTPSAKLYHDSRGDTLFCFSEQRRYKPSDVLVKGLLEQSLYSIFYNIWKQLSTDKREKVLSLYGSPVDYIPDSWKENEENLARFRVGETSYRQHLGILLRSVD